jgi:phosphatidylglycerophosphate synthase
MMRVSDDDAPPRTPGPGFRQDLLLPPNLVSLGRIVGIAIAASVVLSGRPLTGLGIGIVAGLSDHLDGYLARKRDEVTELGALLDGLADILFQFLCFALGVALAGWPWYLFIAWGLRDISVTFLRASAAGQGFRIRSSMLAKVAINFNFYAFVLMGLDLGQAVGSEPYSTWLHLFGLWAAHVGVALQWVSGAEYARSYASQYRGERSPRT